MATFCYESKDPREGLSLGWRRGCALPREGALLGDQVPFPPSWGLSTPTPGFRAAGRGRGEVRVSAFRLQAALLTLEIFLACPAAFETLMGGPQSFLTRGGPRLLNDE